MRKCPRCGLVSPERSVRCECGFRFDLEDRAALVTAQAIELLQMSRRELADTIRDEILKNPILDDAVDTASGETKASMESSVPVLELPQILSPAECGAEIARATKLGFTSQQFRGQERLEVRNRVAVDDPSAAAALWTKLSPLIPPLTEFYSAGLRPEPDVPDLATLRPTGLNERLRYYRYSGGERFAPHVDLSHSTGVLRSFLTVIFYLNDDFEGGETDLFGRTVTPKTGAAILFPHELRHEGRPVFRGVKFVLRTDVMFHVGS